MFRSYQKPVALLIIAALVASNLLAGAAHNHHAGADCGHEHLVDACSVSHGHRCGHDHGHGEKHSKHDSHHRHSPTNHDDCVACQFLSIPSLVDVFVLEVPAAGPVEESIAAVVVECDAPLLISHHSRAPPELA